MKGIIVDGKSNPSPANIIASIGVGGTVSALTIVDGGNEYVGSTIDIKFQSPLQIGIGIGTTAIATGSAVEDAINAGRFDHHALHLGKRIWAGQRRQTRRGRARHDGRPGFHTDL